MARRIKTLCSDLDQQILEYETRSNAIVKLKQEYTHAHKHTHAHTNTQTTSTMRGLMFVSFFLCVSGLIPISTQSPDQRRICRVVSEKVRTCACLCGSDAKPCYPPHAPSPLPPPPPPSVVVLRANMLRQKHARSRASLPSAENSTSRRVDVSAHTHCVCVCAGVMAVEVAGFRIF